MTGGGAPPAVAGGAPRAARAATLALVALGAWLLWVPVQRVVLMHDMLGYAAQGRSLFEGAGNVVRLDGQPIPGYYPAGLPALVAAAYAVLGDDLRHAQVVVWVAALALLALAAATARRLAGTWAGPLAVLLLLASPALRGVATLVLSQVPTAALMLVAALLFLRPGAGPPLFAAGLVASSTLLLRYANASFPAALGLAGLLSARARGVPALRVVLVLGGGGLAGAGLVLLHNAWAYGGPLDTGYAAWGHDVGSQFALSNVFAPQMIGHRGDESLFLRSFLGLGELYAVPVLPLAAWGLVVLWRSGGMARAAALLAACVVAAQDLFLSCYAFRSEAYLVPALPFTVLPAAAGTLDLARRLAPARATALALAAGAALLLVGLRQGVTPLDPAEEEALARHAGLAQAAAVLEPDAALVTVSDFPLVETLLRAPGRRIAYGGPFVSRLIEDAAMREVGGGRYRPERIVAWVGERLAEGRPVWLDQFPPPRGLVPAHRKLRDALRAAYRLEASEVPGFFRVLPRA